jgi:hypothetical protein
LLLESNFHIWDCDLRERFKMDRDDWRYLRHGLCWEWTLVYLVFVGVADLLQLSLLVTIICTDVFVLLLGVFSFSKFRMITSGVALIIMGLLTLVAQFFPSAQDRVMLVIGLTTFMFLMVYSVPRLEAYVNMLREQERIQLSLDFDSDDEEPT